VRQATVEQPPGQALAGGGAADRFSRPEGVDRAGAGVGEPQEAQR
jgi:hypothetical protein